MALAMVQGHFTDTLLAKAVQAQPWYVFQQMFHGSTAPGFLFASGFVAGLPRAPLSLRASLRRARRLLFVLGVGYFLHLPYFSLWKTVGASSPAERALLFACDALQVIAATQLFVLLLQWVAGRHWTRWAGALAVAVIAATPLVWSSGLSARLPEALAPWLDESTGSRFPVFPFAAFVLAGTLAGATLGRAEPKMRHRREVAWGLGLVALGVVLGRALAGRVDYWGASPAYVFVRLGGLLLLLRLVEAAATRARAGHARPRPSRSRDAARLRAAPHPAVRGRVRRLAPHAVARPDGPARRPRGPAPAAAGAARRRLAVAHGQAPGAPRGAARPRVRDGGVPVRVRWCGPGEAAPGVSGTAS